jgi:hypothetical protein
MSFLAFFFTFYKGGFCDDFCWFDFTLVWANYGNFGLVET